MPAAVHCKQNLRLLSYRNCNWIHGNVVIISLQLEEDNIDGVLSRKTFFFVIPSINFFWFLFDKEEIERGRS